MNVSDFLSPSVFNDVFSSLTPAQRVEFNYYEILGDISRTLVEYRIEHSLNQKQLSELLGVTQSMISKYESGDYNISIRALNELCSKLGFSLHVDIAVPRDNDVSFVPGPGDLPENYVLQAA